MYVFYNYRDNAEPLEKKSWALQGHKILSADNSGTSLAS